MRRKILGENTARLMGVDIEAKKRELYGIPEKEAVHAAGSAA
jgi:hypothetical protein